VEVATGYPLSMRRALFDLTCDGVGMACATGRLGVSYGVGRVLWYQAGAMSLKVEGDGGGLVMPGVPDSPADWDTARPGRQIMIMRPRDQGMMQADIASQFDFERRAHHDSCDRVAVFHDPASVQPATPFCAVGGPSCRHSSWPPGSVAGCSP